MMMGTNGRQHMIDYGEKIERVSTRVPVNLKRAIVEAAKAEKRTPSDYVRIVLEDAVSHNQKKRGNK